MWIYFLIDSQHMINANLKLFLKKNITFQLKLTLLKTRTFPNNKAAVQHKPVTWYETGLQ